MTVYELCTKHNKRMQQLNATIIMYAVQDDSYSTFSFPSYHYTGIHYISVVGRLAQVMPSCQQLMFQFLTPQPVLRRSDPDAVLSPRSSVKKASYQLLTCEAVPNKPLDHMMIIALSCCISYSELH